MCRDTPHIPVVSITVEIRSARWLSGLQLSEDVPPRTRIREFRGEYKNLQDSRAEDNAPL